MRVHFSIWLASASAVESRSIGSGTIALSKKYMIRASATKNIMPRVAARRVMPMTILQFDGWLSDGLSPQRFQDIMVQPARHCCLYRKLNPNVLMMKRAQDGVRNYGAGSLNRTRDRRILLQRPMRSKAVVIGRIVFQNSAQMYLAQNDDVIQTLAPDRSDQPFGKAILPS